MTEIVMFDGASRPRGSSLLMAAIVAIGCTAMMGATAWAQRIAPGHIVGHIDGISLDGDHFFISGWACQQRQTKSIAVHVFADRSVYDKPAGTFVIAGTANIDGGSDVAQACQDRQGNHRFLIELPSQMPANGSERKLFVHGIRIVNGVLNDAIAGSGTSLGHLPKLPLQYSTVASLPTVAGAYRSLIEHPRVFATTVELKEIASRINRPGSYSMRRFGQLAGQVARDLASPNNWSEAYSGCVVTVYLYAFSYEPQDGDATEIVRSALKLDRNAKGPAGAAVVASRLALYAALVKAGATLPAGAPSADQAGALAKRIVLTWANRGFRDEGGHFRRSTSQFCSLTGTPENPALHLSRGVVYSVDAQDLLMYLGILSDSETKQLQALHSAIYDVLRLASNSYMGGSHPACEHFANGGANALAALLAIARVLDDGRKFDAVLNGVDRALPMLPAWTVFFDHAIYGKNDSPIECYPNAGPSSLASLGHGAYTTANVSPGEVQDRYRNGNAGQGIGYPMFTLERLINAAEIMRIAGYDPYGYRGNHQQSIEMAISYYACYGKSVGFNKVVTAENSGSCPNAPQYYGKVVNDVDRMVQFGAYRFPGNASITGVEAAAKLSTSEAVNTFSTDAILFGKWRD